MCPLRIWLPSGGVDIGWFVVEKEVGVFVEDSFGFAGKMGAFGGPEGDLVSLLDSERGKTLDLTVDPTPLVFDRPTEVLGSPFSLELVSDKSEEALLRIDYPLIHE